MIKSKTNKLISLLLTICMMMGLINTTAFGEVLDGIDLDSTCGNDRTISDNYRITFEQEKE